MTCLSLLGVKGLREEIPWQFLLLMEVGFIPPELTTIPERASSSPFYNIHPHSL